MSKGRRGGPRRDVREEQPAHRMNGDIRVPEVRLVGDNLEEISAIVGAKVEPEIYPTHRVRSWAEAAGLDLVEIAATAKPPVVRIIDYNKFLYDKKKKEKEMKAKAAKTVIKEIRFGPNTDEHDFNFKVKHGQSFLEEGSKVKSYVFFKGRAIVFKDRGELLLLKFIKEMEEYGSPEGLPTMEGRRMIVVIAPKKKNK